MLRTASVASRSQQIEPDITVQYAVSRRSGIPHARSLRQWAVAALAASRRRRAGTLTIRIVGAAESRRLNRHWRGKDKPTNVLSFPCVLARSQSPGASSPLPLGDLVICAPIVAREAKEQGKSPHAHWSHMVVHGVLHLLGYDHELDRDAEVMEAREMNLLATFGYPNPYA